DAPEQIGAEGDIAFTCQPVTKVAHDLVDAENLLNDHDAWMGTGSGRFCETAGKRAVRTFDCDGFAAHCMPPWYRECRDRDCSGPDAPMRGGVSARRKRGSPARSGRAEGFFARREQAGDEAAALAGLLRFGSGLKSLAVGAPPS